MMLAKELKALAQWCKWGHGRLVFHDVGELEIPDRLVKRTEPLNKSELAFVATARSTAFRSVRKWAELPEILQVIAQHHERVEAAAFPPTLAVQMSLLSRIVSLVNAYDELCNHPDPNCHRPCTKRCR